MGSPEFALPSLKALHNHPRIDLIGIFSRKDAPKGRKKVLTPTPIKAWAKDHYPIFTPETKTDLVKQVEALNPDLAVVIAYGMILPKILTDSIFCVNVHGSILPSYRGASPIHAALLNGDSKTGITLIKMNEKMDEGDILSIYERPLSEKDNFQDVHDSLSQLSAKACIDLANTFPNITATPQNHSQASVCHKLRSSDFELLQSDSSETKLRKIRAFSPYPGAYISINDKRVKILDAEFKEKELIPTVVKPEGKSAMSFHDYCLSQAPFTL